jgi:hypothetical protein
MTILNRPAEARALGAASMSKPEGEGRLQGHLPGGREILQQLDQLPLFITAINFFH